MKCVVNLRERILQMITNNLRRYIKLNKRDIEIIDKRTVNEIKLQQLFF